MTLPSTGQANFDRDRLGAGGRRTAFFLVAGVVFLAEALPAVFADVFDAVDRIATCAAGLSTIDPGSFKNCPS